MKFAHDCMILDNGGAQVTSWALLHAMSAMLRHGLPGMRMVCNHDMMLAITTYCGEQREVLLPIRIIDTAPPNSIAFVDESQLLEPEPIALLVLQNITTGFEMAGCGGKPN
jgi:hypothetical protein